MEAGWKPRSPSVDLRTISEGGLDERCLVGLPSVLLRPTKFSFSSSLSSDFPRNRLDIVRYDCTKMCGF